MLFEPIGDKILIREIEEVQTKAGILLAKQTPQVFKAEVVKARADQLVKDSDIVLVNRSNLVQVSFENIKHYIVEEKNILAVVGN